MSNKSDIPNLITLKEASAILKVHENTLRQWDNKGILKAIRLGIKKVRKYRQIDIENFIKNHESK